MSKRCIRLNSILTCILNVTVLLGYRFDFNEFRIKSFFTGVQKRILIHYSLQNQVLRSMVVSKQCFRLRLNLICSLQITLAILILV